MNGPGEFHRCILPSCSSSSHSLSVPSTPMTPITIDTPPRLSSAPPDLQLQLQQRQIDDESQRGRVEIRALSDFDCIARAPTPVAAAARAPVTAAEPPPFALDRLSTTRARGSWPSARVSRESILFRPPALPCRWLTRRRAALPSAGARSCPDQTLCSMSDPLAANKNKTRLIVVPRGRGKNWRHAPPCAPVGALF